MSESFWAAMVMVCFAILFALAAFTGLKDRTHNPEDKNLPLGIILILGVVQGLFGGGMALLTYFDR